MSTVFLVNLQPRRVTFGVDWAGSYSCFRCPVRKGDKWYHVGPSGRPSYEARFDWVGPFRESSKTAPARKDGKNILIDTEGRIVD